MKKGRLEVIERRANRLNPNSTHQELVLHTVDATRHMLDAIKELARHVDANIEALERMVL